MLVLLFIALWFILRGDLFCPTLCYFVLVFFSTFSIASISLGEERANLSAFCTFVWFALVRFCCFPLLLGVSEGLRYVIVALPGHFSYFFISRKHAYIILTRLNPTHGYTLFFLFLLKNIDCWHSLESPCQGGSTKYPQSMFWGEIWKTSEFLIKIFSVFGGEIFYIFE